jgi:hypothetical protein
VLRIPWPVPRTDAGRGINGGDPSPLIEAHRLR